MLKRKPLMFFTLVFAIAALFAATKVIAEEDCIPRTCTAGSITVSIYERSDDPNTPADESRPWPWLIKAPTLDPYSSNPTTAYECGEGNYPCEIREYELSSGEGIVEAHFILDELCQNIPVYRVGGASGFLRLPPGSVECRGGAKNRTCIGDGIYGDSILRINLNFQNAPRFWIATAPASNTHGSLALATSQAMYFCNPGIIVPFEEREIPIGGRTWSECANFTAEYPGLEPADLSFYMIRDPKDGCIARIWACEGHDCSGCADQVCPTTSACVEIMPEIEDENVVLRGSFLRTCPTEQIFVTKNSPWYGYDIASGSGKAYRVCYDVVNKTYVDKSYCPLLGWNW